MSVLQVVNTDVFIEEGDSTEDPAFPYQVTNGFFRFIDSFYIKQRVTRRPKRIRKAVNGSTTTTVEARLSAELAVNPGITAGMMVLGVNDVHTGVDPSVYGPKVTSIMSKFSGASVNKGIWVGPLCWGEDGGFSSGIATFDATVAPIVTALTGWIYVSLLQTVFNILEPSLNPSNLVVGPLTTPDSVGVHENPFGTEQICQVLTSYLQLV